MDRLAAVLLGAALAACAPAAIRPARRATPEPARVVAAADAHARLEALARAARGAFRRDAAMALVRAADAGFRARGNAAFVATLDAVERHLRDAGFTGARGAIGSVAREALSHDAVIWDARAASLELVEPTRETLLAFDAANDAHRTMVLAYSSPGDVTAELVALGRDPAAARAVGGRIVLTSQPAAAVAHQLAQHGAAAVLSDATEAFNQPARYPDTVRYEMFEGEGPRGVPAMNVSPRVSARLRELLARGKVVLRARADVALRRGRADTLVARIDGSDADAGPVVLVAHVDEPGANDNGSGVAALAETAAVYARMIREGTAPRPRRSVVFLFGMEIEASTRWLQAHAAPRPAFSLSIDMVGEPPAIAPMLVERMPDPGNVVVRGGDEHTAWWSGGRGYSRPGSFLNAYVLAAMRRVDPAWPVRDHPYEGGSDHVPFLSRGIPAILLWHFPDDAYHTNRDRLARVDAEEMARESAGVTALIAHGAAAGELEALELVAVVEAYARERLERESALSRAAVAAAGGAAAREREREHLGAWARHMDECLAACARFPVATSAALEGAIEAARRRVREAYQTAIAGL